jgi:small membrane protein
MWQQIIAVLIILFIVYRQSVLKKKKLISSTEHKLWIIFWFLGIIVIIFIKQIDRLVGSLGFSSSGINVLLYLAIILLFYYIFRLRIKIEKIEKNITEIVRNISLNAKK